MSTAYFTPAEIAEQLGIDVSQRRGGRPRWRISSDALEAFLAAHSTCPSPKPTSQRRKSQVATQYY